MVTSETRTESGSHGMPKMFANVADLAKYARARLRPQTFGNEDSRFKIEAIEVEITEKSTVKEI